MRKIAPTKWTLASLMVGVLAAVYVIIAREFNLILWAAFISWPLYFLAGATIKKVDEAVIGLTGGLLTGWGFVQLMPFFTELFGPFFAMPILVVIAGFIIIFLEIVPEFDMAPSYFLSFAAFFAAMGIIDPATSQAYGPGFSTVIKLWLPLMIGLVCAFISSKMVGLIIKDTPKESGPAPVQ